MKKLLQVNIFIFLIILLIIMCSDNNNVTVLARVGESRLTKEDLLRKLDVDNLNKVDYHHLLSIINRWVDMELVYQKALESGLRKDPKIEQTIKSEIKKIEKSIIIDKFYSINIDSHLEFSNDELIDYYNENKEDYIIAERRYYIHHISTADRESYNKIKEVMNKSIGFEKIMTMDIENCRYYNYKPKYVRLTDLDEAVANEVKDMKIGEIRNLTAGNEYHFIKLNDIKRKGDFFDFEDVKDRIIIILTYNKRKELKDNLISNLRSNNVYQINFNKLRELSGVEENTKEGEN